MCRTYVRSHHGTEPRHAGVCLAHITIAIELSGGQDCGISQDLGAKEGTVAGEVVGDVPDVIAVVRKVCRIGIRMVLPHDHLNVCLMIAHGGVYPEMYVFLVELVVAVLHQFAIETAPFGIEGTYAVRLSEHHALPTGLRVGILAAFLLLVVHDWLIAKAVDGVAKGFVQDGEVYVADVVALMWDDAVGHLHVFSLRFFAQLDFRIQVSLVPDTELHVVASLQGTLSVVDDRSFAQLTQETVEALRAVPA